MVAEKTINAAGNITTDGVEVLGRMVRSRGNKDNSAPVRTAVTRTGCATCYTTTCSHEQMVTSVTLQTCFLVLTFLYSYMHELVLADRCDAVAVVSSVLSSTTLFHQSRGTKCPWAAFWMHTNSFLATFSSRNSREPESVSDWFDLPLKRKPLTQTPLWSWRIPLMKANNPQQQQQQHNQPLPLRPQLREDRRKRTQDLKLVTWEIISPAADPFTLFLPVDLTHIYKTTSQDTQAIQWTSLASLGAAEYSFSFHTMCLNLMIPKMTPTNHLILYLWIHHKLRTTDLCKDSRGS